MKGILLSIFVSFAVLVTVSGLKCYDCRGTEKDCAKEKLDSDKEKTCESGLDTCARTWGKSGDVTAVVNYCTTEALCKAAQDAKCEGDDCAVGCCDTDLCNAGSPVSFSVFLMSACCVLGLALLK